MHRNPFSTETLPLTPLREFVRQRSSDLFVREDGVFTPHPISMSPLTSRSRRLLDLASTAKLSICTFVYP